MSENTQEVGGVVPDIYTESGTVVEISESTETSVSGSIGPDGRGGTSGYIGSATVDRQKIWLRLADGSERWYRWTGYDVPLRKGHNVSAVLVRGERHLYVVAIVNHTTNEYFFTFADPDWVIKEIGADPEKRAWGVGLVTGLAIMLIAFLVVEDRGFMRFAGLALGGLFALAIGVGVVSLAHSGGQSDRRKQLTALLNQHCSEVLRKGFPDSAS